MPKLIGAGKAKQMIFTAQIVSGREAHEIGLVEEVVPANQECNAAYLKALEIALEIGTKVLHFDVAIVKVQQYILSIL